MGSRDGSDSEDDWLGQREDRRLERVGMRNKCETPKMMMSTTK